MVICRATTHEATKPALAPFVAGTGVVEFDDQCGRLTLPEASRHAYSDAQVQDYAGLARRDYPWRPPLHFSIEARFSSSSAWHRGIWLLEQPCFVAWPSGASSRSVVLLGVAAVHDGTRAGRAGTRLEGRDHRRHDSTRVSMVAVCAHRAARYAAMRAYAAGYGPGCSTRCCSRLSRCSISTAPTWHRYEIFWLRDRLLWGVDGQSVLETRSAPRGPLGLVIWNDNQWARVTPAGSFGAGLLDAATSQWLEYRDLRVTTPR